MTSTSISTKSTNKNSFLALLLTFSILYSNTLGALGGLGNLTVEGLCRRLKMDYSAAPEGTIQRDLFLHRMMNSLIRNIYYLHFTFRGVFLTQEQVKHTFLRRVFFDVLETGHHDAVKNFLRAKFYSIENWYFDIQNITILIDQYKQLMVKLRDDKPTSATSVIPEFELLMNDNDWRNLINMVDGNGNHGNDYINFAANRIEDLTYEQYLLAKRIGKSLSEYRTIRKQVNQIIDRGGANNDTVYSTHAQVLRTLRNQELIGYKGRLYTDDPSSSPRRPSLRDFKNLRKSNDKVEEYHLKSTRRREIRLAFLHLIMTSRIFMNIMNRFFNHLKNQKTPADNVVPKVNFRKLIYDLYGTIVYAPDLIPILPKPGKKLAPQKISKFLRRKTNSYFVPISSSDPFLINFFRHSEFKSVHKELLTLSKEQANSVEDYRFHDLLSISKEEAGQLGNFTSIYDLSHAQIIQIAVVAIIGIALTLGPGGDWVKKQLIEHNLSDFDDEELAALLKNLNQIEKELEVRAIADEQAQASLTMIRRLKEIRGDKIDILDLKLLSPSLLIRLTEIMRTQTDR